jgi:hypothetical protein
MSPSERLAIAAHIHVLLRRKLGRVTDTEWMASNVDYAREILRVCRAEPDPDLQDWAGKLEALLRSLAPRPAPAPAPASVPPDSWPDTVAGDPADGNSRHRAVAQRYVGRLR